DLHLDAVRAAQAVAVAESELARLRGQRQAGAAQHNCPLERRDCPLHAAPAAEGSDEQVLEVEARCRALRDRHAPAERRYAEERRRRQEEASAALGDLGRWRLLAEQLQEYQAAQKKRDAAVARAEVLERLIRESRERQEAARGERDRRHARL